MPSHALYIPFDHAYYEKMSGPTTFLRNLQQFCHATGFPTAISPNDAHVIFFPMQFPLNVLKKFKRTGGYILQRLDGVYYPTKHGDAYKNFNALMETIYHEYTDFVIFQSQYSRTQCFAQFGPCAHFRIIINGADTSLFYSSSQTQLHAKSIRFVTTGFFRNPDMIEPIVLALDTLQCRFPFELTVVGPLLNPHLEYHFQRPYLRYVKTSLPLNEIADILRQSDIFIYSHLNPPCPNSVVEAISCGLPVVGFDSGSMAELCFFSKELLAPVSDEVFQKYEDFNFRKLAEKIEAAVEGYDHYRQIAMAHRSDYSFETCGRQYAEVFEIYLNKRRKVIPYAKSLFEERMQQTQRQAKRFKDCLVKRTHEEENVQPPQLPITAHQCDSSRILDERREDTHQIPKISVVMSVYNGERYLQKAIDSILRQTLTNFELILINDGSTDASREIILSHTDSRIRLIENASNLGLAASLNIGFRLARGEYLARMDADDISLPDRLERQAAFLDAHRKIGLVGSWSTLIDEAGKELRILRFPLHDLEIRWASFLSNPFLHPTVMLRRNLLEEHHLEYDPTFHSTQDYELWTHVLEYTQGANLSDVLVAYRLNSTSITTQLKTQQLQNHDMVALRTIRRELPGFPISQEQVAQLREAFVGGTMPKDRRKAEMVRLSGIYLDMLAAFAKTHTGHPALRDLQHRETARIASKVLRWRYNAYWMPILRRAIRLYPWFFVPVLQGKMRRLLPR